jgi:hypothetical protein
MSSTSSPVRRETMLSPTTPSMLEAADDGPLTDVPAETRAQVEALTRAEPRRRRGGDDELKRAFVDRSEVVVERVPVAARIRIETRRRFDAFLGFQRLQNRRGTQSQDVVDQALDQYLRAQGF